MTSSILLFTLLWSSILFGAILTRSLQEKDNSISSISLKLENIPHRIYLSGDEVLQSLNNFHNNHDSTQMKFTYELVKPFVCEVFKPTFGCCWDNKTVAVGPNGEGCPVCKDEKSSCRKWKDHCHDQVIRAACPESCRACPKKTKKCHDTLDQTEYCGLYKRFGLCKREQIRKHCRNTCDACMTNNV